jgi:hypothetical protein
MLLLQVSDLKTINEKLEVEVKFNKSSLEELEEENESLKSKLEKQEKNIKILKENRQGSLDEKENFGSNIFDISNETDDPKVHDSQELTFMESPNVSYRSCAISVGEKRKALSQSSCSQQGRQLTALPSKKLKYGNLLEIGTIPFTDGKGYNGFGGRSNPDLFPEPLAIKRPLITKRPVSNKPKKTSLQAKVEKNQMTVDRFFGSFETP